MKIIRSALTWVPIVAVFLYALWYHNGYALLAAWIVILGLYLSNAFERINELQTRIEALESEMAGLAQQRTAC